MDKRTQIFCTDIPISLVGETNWLNSNLVGTLEENAAICCSSRSLNISKMNIEKYSKIDLKYTKNPRIPFPTIVDKNDSRSLLSFAGLEEKRKGTAYVDLTTNQTKKNEVNKSMDHSLIGAIDNFGNFEVLKYQKGYETTRTDETEKKEGEGTEVFRAIKKRKLDIINPIKLQYSIKKRLNKGEDGKSSIDFSISDGKKDGKILATSLFFEKELNIYNNGALESQYYLNFNPFKIKYIELPISGNPLIAVLEENQVSFIDPRKKNFVKCMKPDVDNFSFYDIDYKDNMVGVLGESKNAYFIDIKNWKVSKKWNKCLSRKPCFMKFSNVADVVYVGGHNMISMKNLAVEKKDHRRKTGGTNTIYFDSQIMGMDVAANDNICTFSEKKYYLIKNPYQICQ